MKSGRKEHPEFTLKDARLYEIEINDAEIVLTNIETKETREAAWDRLTEIYVVAIDEFPIGKISFVLHMGDDLLEIPADAKGNEALLESFQKRLSGFDNVAFIEAMGMLHGFKKIWAKS